MKSQHGGEAQSTLAAEVSVSVDSQEDKSKFHGSFPEALSRKDFFSPEVSASQRLILVEPDGLVL